MREEKCSNQQINSLERHGTTAQGKVCSIGLNRSLFCSTLAYDSKLSEHKQLGRRYRFCLTKLVDIREVGEEWGRVLEARKKQGEGTGRILELLGQRTQTSKGS